MQEWGPGLGKSSEDEEFDEPAVYLYLPNGIDSDEYDSDHYKEPYDEYQDRSEELDVHHEWAPEWETAIEFTHHRDAAEYFGLVDPVLNQYRSSPKVGLRALAGEFKKPIELIADILVRNLYRPPLRDLWDRQIELAEVLNAFEFIRDIRNRFPPSLGEWDWHTLGGKFQHGIHHMDMGISSTEFLIVRVEMGTTHLYTRA